jgi:Membrane domain of glycerophosphoryl diester phosphodiesterase
VDYGSSGIRPSELESHFRRKHLNMGLTPVHRCKMAGLSVDRRSHDLFRIHNPFDVGSQHDSGNYIRSEQMGLSETGFLLVGAMALLPIAGGLLLSFWALACIAFAVPAAAVEDLNGIEASRRSWTLTKGSRWRIIFVSLTVAISSGILSLVAASLLRILVDICYYRFNWQWFNLPFYQHARDALSAVIASCIGPVYFIALTLLYYDQRVRKEGFDVQMLMETAELEPGATELGAKSFLPGRIAGFEGGSQFRWSMLVRFIRSLRGFD